MRIVITGVTRGLGRALAEEFIALGHTVWGCGRSPEGVLDLRFTYGEPHRWEMVDVADAGKVELWGHKVLAPGEPPDLLINNAALINPRAPLWEVPPAEFKRLIDVNVIGVANVIAVFLPPMLAAGRGVVVNLSSGWGRSVSPGVAPYCASKWAIEGLTKALAEDLPPGLAAIPLSPGEIDTDMLRQAFGDDAAHSIKPAAWAKIAAPYILGLGPQHNGQSLRVPLTGADD
jgi:NAD(P)-dependent dehydrogenase (short-subunit alcohol dehydrogenase family)